MCWGCWGYCGSCVETNKHWSTYRWIESIVHKIIKILQFEVNSKHFYAYLAHITKLVLAMLLCYIECYCTIVCSVSLNDMVALASQFYPKIHLKIAFQLQHSSPNSSQVQLAFQFITTNIASRALQFSTSFQLAF